MIIEKTCEYNNIAKVNTFARLVRIMCVSPSATAIAACRQRRIKVRLANDGRLPACGVQMQARTTERPSAQAEGFFIQGDKESGKPD